MNDTWVNKKCIQNFGWKPYGERLLGGYVCTC